MWHTSWEAFLSLRCLRLFEYQKQEAADGAKRNSRIFTKPCTCVLQPKQSSQSMTEHKTVVAMDRHVQNVAACHVRG